MKRLHNILILLFLSSFSFSFAQEETRVIDSLESVVAKQEGREKVLAMMELSNAFFDFSFDDCVHWSEVAIQRAREIGDVELCLEVLQQASFPLKLLEKAKKTKYDRWVARLNDETDS